MILLNRHQMWEFLKAASISRAFAIKDSALVLNLTTKAVDANKKMFLKQHSSFKNICLSVRRSVHRRAGPLIKFYFQLYLKNYFKKTRYDEDCFIFLGFYAMFSRVNHIVLDNDICHISKIYIYLLWKSHIDLLQITILSLNRWIELGPSFQSLLF